jgi:hypothetical protein
VDVHSFIGQRVRIQFFDPGTMYLLNQDEWPHPVEADCIGCTTLQDDGRLQAYLVLRGPIEVWTGGCSGLSHLVKRPGIDYSLAPLADFYEVQCVREIE